MSRMTSPRLCGLGLALRAAGCTMVVALGTLSCDNDALTSAEHLSLTTKAGNLSEIPHAEADGGHRAAEVQPIPATSHEAERAAFEAILQAQAGPPVPNYQPAELYYGERASLGQSQVTLIAGDNPICLVSHWTPSMAPYARLSMRNHRQYAATHGYNVVQYRGHLTGPRFMDADVNNPVHRYGLYWQKIAAVKKALEMRMVDGTPRCSWVMWLDGDVLLTDFDRPIESVLAPWESPEVAAGGADKDVVLSLQELALPGVLLNAGVFFIRNTEAGNSFVDELMELQPAYQGRSRYGDQDVIHHVALGMDYSLMADMTWKNVAQQQLRPEVGLARSRDFNAFYKNEWNVNPGDGDAFWAPGDFACHFSGRDTAGRVLGMKTVLKQLARAERDK